MNKVGKIITCAVTAAAIVGVSLGVHFGYSDKSFKQEEHTVDTSSHPLRVAIISDLQLPNSTDKNTHQYKSFESTLTMLKNKGMDALIIDGDFTDQGTKNAWNTYKEIYDKVMAGEKEPIKLFVLGNHDYWLPYFKDCFEIPTPATQQKRFTKYTGEPMNSHKVINGYHFICWSSLNGTYDKCSTNKEAVRAELDKAVKDDPNKPIFVITHLNPLNTAYGSDDWGNDDINDVLKDYPQAISISGHSHYSLIDERSIWQNNYTALTTQSLDYIELETGKYNGSIPVDAYGKRIAEDLPACLYMTVENDKVTLERLEANSGKTLKEPWVISSPFDKPSTYTDARKNSDKAPSLDKNLGVQISNIKDVNTKDTQKMISFKAGSDDDFVHSYRLKFYDENKKPVSFDETDYDGNVIKYDENGDKISNDSKDYESGKTKEISELVYFSDFVEGLENMSDNAKLRLPKNMPENVKYIGISAIDSWGKESDEVICDLGV